MRISNSQIFSQGLNNSARQQLETLRLQQILSSTKKIQTPSDDPVAAAKINLMSEQISLGLRLQRNRQAAESQLSLEERTISHAVEVIQRVRVLQVQAGNTSLGATEREALAIETEQLLNQLQGIANTQDSEGNYIFSGSLTNAEAISRDSTGQFIYNGDQTQRFQPVTTGLQMALNDSGADLFMQIREGNGQFTVAESGTPNTGSARASSGSVIDAIAYVADTYTVQFALNSMNETVVLVSGAVSGNVIPPSGLPDDAPLYKDGSEIAFNGLQITVSGKPDAGDSFIVAPSGNTSIFAIVADMVDNLRQPFANSQDQAHVFTRNNQILEQLDSSLNHLLDNQAEVGARLNQLDIAEEQNTDLINTSREAKSLLEDANLAEVTVQLELQRIYLQIAQQSFASIQGLSIFNYL